MNYKKVMRILLVVITVAIVGWSSTVFASDYKYKINDPRYNTSVQFAIPDVYNNNLSQDNPVDKKKRNTQLLIIISMIVIPGLLIFSTIKNIEPRSQYRKRLFSEEFKDSMKTILMAIINMLIVISKKIIEIFRAAASESLKYRNQHYKPATVHTSSAKKTKSELPQDTKTIQTTEKTEKAESVKLQKKEHKTDKSEFSISEYLSSPIQKPQNPILLSSSKLTRNKGLCLVQYKNKVSLIGYINKKVFVLAQFNSLSTNEIRSRLAENEGSNERYIVKLGNYKALLEVSENNMELLLEL